MEQSKSDRLAIAKQHLKRAEESLQSAKTLLENELYADSVSRAYSAAYHSAYSLLYFLGFDPKSHKGLHNLFYIHVIQTNLLDKKVIKCLSKLMEEGSTADYGAIPVHDLEEGKQMADNAEFVYNQVSELLARLSSE